MPKKTAKELEAINRRIQDDIGNLFIEYPGDVEFRDIPHAKAVRKMKARGFADVVDTQKRYFRSRNMPAGKVEEIIARHLGVTVDALRKRLQRAK